jgi:hypothetical protein
LVRDTCKKWSQGHLERKRLGIEEIWQVGHIENEPAEAVNMLTDQWPSWGVRKRVRRGIRAERLF